jgi:hypothetical protein
MLVAILVATVATASAQTTKPAPEPFAQVLTNLSNGLVNGDVTTLSKLITTQTRITSFDGDVSETGGRIFAATNGGTIVTSRCYHQLPVNLASDIATDFSNASCVPDLARKQMTPDANDVVKANVTAAQWIAQTLNPSGSQLIGVIVIWPAPPPVSVNRRPEPLRPVFVLVKADLAANGITLNQIVFGYPLDHT